MSDLVAQRVLERWAKAWTQGVPVSSLGEQYPLIHQAKARTPGIPVKNKDTGRTVYVLPETLKEDSSRFQKVPPDQVGDPRWRGKPKPPKRPRKPEKPEVPRDAPPAPIRPALKEKPVKRMKPVTDVPEVLPMKVPEPSPPRRWKKLKRFQASEAVVERYLASLDQGARGSSRS